MILFNFFLNIIKLSIIQKIKIIFDRSVFFYKVYFLFFPKGKFELNIVFNLTYKLLIIKFPLDDNLFFRINIYK